jgi:hypothetical protein
MAINLKQLEADIKEIEELIENPETDDATRNVMKSALQTAKKELDLLNGIRDFKSIISFSFNNKSIFQLLYFFIILIYLIYSCFQHFFCSSYEIFHIFMPFMNFFFILFNLLFSSCNSFLKCFNSFCLLL